MSTDLFDLSDLVAFKSALLVQSRKSLIKKGFSNDEEQLAREISSHSDREMISLLTEEEILEVIAETPLILSLVNEPTEKMKRLHEVKWVL